MKWFTVTEVSHNPPVHLTAPRVSLRAGRRRLREVIRNHPTAHRWQFEHDHDGWSRVMTRRQALRHTRFIGQHLQPDHRVAMKNQQTADVYGLRCVSEALLRNPLRDMWSFHAGRIDQGVDYAGGGPFYAIGPAVIKVARSGDSGWPGGGLLVYQLLPEAGAALSGKCVYFAENVSPAVRAGQVVDTETVIGFQHDSFPNDETGWWNLGAGVPMAQSSPENPDHGNTIFGVNFNALMVALGVPSGSLEGERITGTLPRGWPTDWKGVVG